MELENKVISREIQTLLYESGKTLATAESCTSGKIAEAITAVPGASEYFKGGIISYTDEVKEKLLGVDPQLLKEKTAVCQEVRGAINTLNADFAISATGLAGPGGGTKEIPVGTIYVAFGTADDVRVIHLTEDEGRDKNVLNATYTALQAFLDFVKEKVQLPRHVG